MTRPKHEYEAALALVEAGLNDCAIARRLGIPHQTINGWRHGLRTGRGNSSDCPICDGAFLNAPAYCYLLGLYLGDGHIVQMRSCQRLTIYLDARYPEIIYEAARVIDEILPGDGGRVGLVGCDGCIEVIGHWQHWHCLLPQHGPGMKHERPIELWNWQRDLTPVWNRMKTKRYFYPRYQFTNVSDGIRRIFCQACDDLDVGWKQSSWRTISVSRSRDVAKLDRFVGPKR